LLRITDHEDIAMTSASLFRTGFAGPSLAPRIVARIVSGLHWLRVAHAEQRRRARSRRELAQLDARALDDLGISRGELDSCLAEAMGDAEPTRRRIADGALVRDRAL